MNIDENLRTSVKINEHQRISASISEIPRKSYIYIYNLCEWTSHGCSQGFDMCVLHGTSVRIFLDGSREVIFFHQESVFIQRCVSNSWKFKSVKSVEKKSFRRVWKSHIQQKQKNYSQKAQNRIPDLSRHTEIKKQHKHEQNNETSAEHKHKQNANTNTNKTQTRNIQRHPNTET